VFRSITSSKYNDRRSRDAVTHNKKQRHDTEFAAVYTGGPLDFSKDVTASLKAIIDINALAENVAKRLFVDQLAQWQSGLSSLYGEEVADSTKPIVTTILTGSQEFLKRRLAGIYEEAKSFACSKFVVFKMDLDPKVFLPQWAEKLREIAAATHHDDASNMICNMAQQTGSSPDDTVILRANSWLNKARIEFAKMSQQDLPVTPAEDVEDLETVTISTHHFKQLQTIKEVFGNLEEFVTAHSTQLDRSTVIKLSVAAGQTIELSGPQIKLATGQAEELCEQHVVKVAAAWHALCGWSKGFLQNHVPDVQPHLQEPQQEAIKNIIFGNDHRPYISSYHSKISKICKQFKDMDQKLKLSVLITNFPKLLDDLTTELNRVKFVTLVTLGHHFFNTFHRIYSTTHKRNDSTTQTPRRRKNK